MRAIVYVVLGLSLLALSGPVGAEERSLSAHWPKAFAESQQAFERALNAVPSPARLRAWHDLFCAEAHPAGTEADRRMIAKLVGAFESLGLETKREAFHAYLPTFEDARVAVQYGDQVQRLPLREAPIPSDPSIADTVPAAWNAYSASGEASGPVVYANYGTKEDFEKLDALGVSCKGRIVVARYGRNYRGYKARYAEAAGAAGLLMYTDPDDSGYRKGIPYPEGGFADGAYIQRGSIKTLPYAGDPLTPGTPATKDAKRLDPATVALPRIPVQPIGWSAAHEILSRMTGPFVPKGWQGGLPFAYRLTGGADLKVHLKVTQPRRVVPSANVLAYVRGAQFPEQKIVIGCHFDAWTFGAGDPHAGTIVLFEMARSFAAAQKAGLRPARTVIFANWGAEEYGIIGSTEWCEAHAEDLARNGVAYINLDMAAMGPNFRSAAAPLLKQVIEDATRAVPQAGAAKDRTVHAAWTARTDGKAKFGNLGGGSDHVGFYCHLGIPSCSLGAGGSKGVSYHSAYDTLAWYRKVVGDDYQPALMLARVGNVLAARLANAPLIPYDLPRYAADIRSHLVPMEKRLAARKVEASFVRLRMGLDAYAGAASDLQLALEAAVTAGTSTPESLREANTYLLGVERAWLREPGLRGRPWYRSRYAASDPHSGYAAWMLPVLRQAVEEGDPQQVADAAEGCRLVLNRIVLDQARLRARLRVPERR